MLRGRVHCFIDPLSHCCRVECSESNLQLCSFAFLPALCTNFLCFPSAVGWDKLLLLLASWADGLIFQKLAVSVDFCSQKVSALPLVSFLLSF